MSDNVEQKLSELRESQQELRRQSEELHRLQLMQRERDHLAEALDDIIGKVKEREAQLSDAENQVEGGRRTEKLTMELSYLRAEKERLQVMLSEYEKNISSLEYIVKNNKNFDKSKTFKNIRALINRTGVKLGQIEKDAGCQPGYMSRLEKQGNTTDPSVEFLVTAADALNVSIDFLINGEIEVTTPTENYLLDFLRHLIKGTIDDDIIWKQETATTLKRIDDSDAELYNCHPLCRFDLGDGTESQTTNLPFFDVKYKSRFFINELVEISGNCYRTKLMKNNDTEVYIISCKKELNEKQSDNYFEVYLIRENDVTPLFCSIRTVNEIASETVRLYETIEESVQHVHLGEEAKSFIDSFIEARQLLDF